MKSPAAEYSGFVEHPRYGKAPRFTGLDVTDSPDGQVYCHWHSAVGVRVPGTAVVADVARQRPATLHVTHYFDAKRVCRTCGRPFLFFADEQKYWYEDLEFPLEADCVAFSKQYRSMRKNRPTTELRRFCRESMA